MANFKVRFDLDAPWIETLESELLRFPNGEKDDQADCLAQVCHITQGRDLWTPPPPEPDRPGTMGALAGHAEMLQEERRPPVDPFPRHRRADLSTPDKILQEVEADEKVRSTHRVNRPSHAAPKLTRGSHASYCAAA